MSNNKGEGWVDVIDDGRIVKVSESYAQSEGLPIIRRYSPEVHKTPSDKPQAQPISSREKKGLLRFEEFRRPLKGDRGIINELKDNFHWDLVKLRKSRGLSRKQVADAIGVNENDLKMFEHGVLTKEDYVLIGKVENYYRINLRKDKSLSGSALQNALGSKSFGSRLNEKDREKSESGKEGVSKDLVSDEDIEIDDSV
ncbi:MAG: hypothetical protein AABX66_00155 [Nanoarchaeota archaeon]